MCKLNFNGVNNMKDARCTQIDGVFGVRRLGAAFRLNEKRRRAIPLANSKMKSFGGTHLNCPTYQSEKKWDNLNVSHLQFASGIPSRRTPKAAAISSHVADFIQL
ncbi:MAG TPA: hypothetical protein VFY40_19885 [Blastocatellia bacterium]|nr:hypothetical protein [Blastocatellia bacterium]